MPKKSKKSKKSKKLAEPAKVKYSVILATTHDVVVMAENEEEARRLALDYASCSLRSVDTVTVDAADEVDDDYESCTWDDTV